MQYCVRFERKLVLFMFTVLLVLLTSGCSDFEDIGTTNVILAMGVDLASDGQVEVSVEYYTPGEKQNDSSGSQGTSGMTEVRSASGSTITDALEKFNETLPRSLYLGHNTLVVFGKSYVEGGIEQALDYLEKQKALRRNELLVMTDGSAKELLTASTSPQQINAFGIRTIADQVGKQSLALDSVQFRVMRSYLSPSHSMLLMKYDRGTDGGIQFNGVGVIQDGKLVLNLGMEDMLAIALLCGPTHMITLTIPCKGGKLQANGKDDIRLLRTLTRIEPVINGKSVDCNVKIKGQAEVERLCPSSDMSTTLISDMERAAEEEIQLQVQNLVQKCQENHVDMMELGTLIFRKDPEFWKSIASDFPSYMSKVRFHFDVRIQILRTGLSDNSPERAYSPTGTSSAR